MRKRPVPEEKLCEDIQRLSVGEGYLSAKQDSKIGTGCGDSSHLLIGLLSVLLDCASPTKFRSQLLCKLYRTA